MMSSQQPSDVDHQQHQHAKPLDPPISNDMNTTSAPMTTTPPASSTAPQIMTVPVPAPPPLMTAAPTPTPAPAAAAPRAAPVNNNNSLPITHDDYDWMGVLDTLGDGHVMPYEYHHNNNHNQNHNNHNNHNNEYPNNSNNVGVSANATAAAMAVAGAHAASVATHHSQDGSAAAAAAATAAAVAAATNADEEGASSAARLVDHVIEGINANNTTSDPSVAVHGVGVHGAVHGGVQAMHVATSVPQPQIKRRMSGQGPPPSSIAVPRLPDDPTTNNESDTNTTNNNNNGNSEQSPDGKKRARVERKRSREKQRRLDTNSQFSALADVVREIETTDFAEEARRHLMGGGGPLLPGMVPGMEGGVGVVGGGGGASDRAGGGGGGKMGPSSATGPASSSPGGAGDVPDPLAVSAAGPAAPPAFNPSNRVDLIARTIAQLTYFRNLRRRRNDELRDARRQCCELRKEGEELRRQVAHYKAVGLAGGHKPQEKVMMMVPMMVPQNAVNQIATGYPAAHQYAAASGVGNPHQFAAAPWASAASMIHPSAAMAMGPGGSAMHPHLMTQAVPQQPQGNAGQMMHAAPSPSPTTAGGQGQQQQQQQQQSAPAPMGGQPAPARPGQQLQQSFFHAQQHQQQLQQHQQQPQAPPAMGSPTGQQPMPPPQGPTGQAPSLHAPGAIQQQQQPMALPAVMMYPQVAGGAVPAAQAFRMHPPVQQQQVQATPVARPHPIGAAIPTTGAPGNNNGVQAPLTQGTNQAPPAGTGGDNPHPTAAAPSSEKPTAQHQANNGGGGNLAHCA